MLFRSRFQIKSIWGSRTHFVVSSTLFSQMPIFSRFWSFSLERVQNKEFIAQNLPTISGYQIKSIWLSKTHFVVSSTLFSQMSIFSQFWSFSLERVENKEFVARNFPNRSRYQIKSICWSRTRFVVSSTQFSQLAIFGPFLSFSLEKVENKDFVLETHLLSQGTK